MWIWILIIVITIGAILGYIGSDSNEKGKGCLGGALAGGIGCGYIIFSIFMCGVGIMILVWIMNFLFG